MHFAFDFHLPLWTIVTIGVLAFLWLAWRIYVGTWTHFLAVFHLEKVETELQKAGKRLPPASRFFGYWVVLPKGLWLDFWLNMLATLAFLDPPREFLLTARLQRYVDGPDGWRRRWALKIDADKLEPYDPGHIRK